jgi:hypothetical protein
MGRVPALAVTVALLASLIISTAAQAAVRSDEQLISVGGAGTAAGQLTAATGIASDPVTGHVYVAEESHRISEFTPWGGFVKAFGWDVAPGAVNEQQEVRVRAASGQFRLSFGGAETMDLAFNAPGSASEGPGSLEAALNSLPTIGGAGASISVRAVPGTGDGKTPSVYVVTFKGALAGSDVAQLATATGATPLGGGVPQTEVEARTLADGTKGGTGLESCTEESGCQAGASGAGAGEMAGRRARLAVDEAGDLYVAEMIENHRVQKFDSAGRFLLTFGGKVNKTTGDGVTGSGPGEFGPTAVSGLTLDSAGALFVADVERIQRFSLGGEYEAEIPVPGTTVHDLALDPVSSDFYATVGPGGPEVDVRKLDSATGEEIDRLVGAGGGTGALAVDSNGNVYAADGSQVLEFDAAGNPLSPATCCGVPSTIGGLGTSPVGDLYVVYSNFVSSFGPAPVVFEAPPKVPPTIVAQFASSAGQTTAVVKTEINPHFWTDARYYVEYGTGKCSEGGCDKTTPVPPGDPLAPNPTDAPLLSGGIQLLGLEPGTTYHYRFVAQSGGGGPVKGVEGKVGVDGEESTFITFPSPYPRKTDCLNQAFRTGLSARLSNCRAYEMVSPVDKNNGDIKALLDAPGYGTNLVQSADDGNRFTYSSYRGFGAAAGAPYTNQYLATRAPATGWSSENLNPAQSSKVRLNGRSFDNHYKAFSSDLCQAWLAVVAEPPLAPGATDEASDLYRRQNCAGGSYDALIQVEPSDIGAFAPILQGASADGRAAVFLVQDALTEDAADERLQAYFASEGKLSLICVGPDGAPTDSNCSVGTAPSQTVFEELERLPTLTHAVSENGNRVYWTDSGKQKFKSGEPYPLGPGQVYLRENPEEEQSAMSGGACVEPDKACTIKVSGTKTSKSARFVNASVDGGQALFEVTEGALAGKLYKFTLGVGSSEIAGKVLGVAAASDDLSRVYFVSEEAVAGTTGGTAGRPNLYLDDEGTKTFIATLSDEDVFNKIPSDATSNAIFHAARTTPDGRTLVFISTAAPTGYDTTDQLSGKEDSEVYLYQVEESGPICISCNPTGARPVGRVVQGTGNASKDLATASSLAMPETNLYSPGPVPADGRRLFFNSFDALLPRDGNGREDVYEWERAPDQSACEEAGAELYVPAAAGCLSLISTGESPSDSELLDASDSGDDVFFTTNESLVLRDPGLVDVYDARAGGGIPEPPLPPPPCQGESCQPPVGAPGAQNPSSSSFVGPEDQKPKKKHHKAGKKHRKKHKKKTHHHKRGVQR